MTLTEFLLARIAEDEAWRVTRFREGHLPTPRELREADRWKAECEAKRQIVARHTEHQGFGADDEWRDHCETLRHLATVYADHPDYREEWRPRP